MTTSREALRQAAYVLVSSIDRGEDDVALAGTLGRLLVAARAHGICFEQPSLPAMPDILQGFERTARAVQAARPVPRFILGDAGALVPLAAVRRFELTEPDPEHAGSVSIVADTGSEDAADVAVLASFPGELGPLAPLQALTTLASWLATPDGPTVVLVTHRSPPGFLATVEPLQQAPA